jgi:tetratricopeptide (TPR) repeat protein
LDTTGTYMAQRDYILRLAEAVGRALAQVLYHREIKDYQGALNLIDEQLKQTVGMGLGFIHSVSDETLLSLLTSLGELNVDKAYMVATLLKAEGDVYTDQGNPDEAYYSYLKSLNLFLEIVLLDNNLRNTGGFPEVEHLLSYLEEYELPTDTKRLLFRYYAQTGRSSQAQAMLQEALQADPTDDELIEQGIDFYQRLKRKGDSALLADNFTREKVEAALARLMKLK